MKLLKTSNNEDAIRILSSRHKHVIVKPMNSIPRPIRLRGNMIADLPLYLYKEWVTESEGQFAAWKENGGVLLDYPWSNPRKWPDGRRIPHDAHLHVECPLSMEKFEKDVLECRNEAVIFRPPSWQWHDMQVDLTNPHADVLRRVFDTLHSLASKPSSKRNAAACDALGVPYAGVAACDDGELAKAAQITDDKLYAIRKRMEEEAIERDIMHVVCVVPRIEPTDFVLRDFWNRIKGMPDMHRGERMLVPDQMKKIRGDWKKLIKQLVREGNLQKGYSVYVYPVMHYEPDWDLANNKRKVAMLELKQIKEAVDKAEGLK